MRRLGRWDLGGLGHLDNSASSPNPLLVRPCLETELPICSWRLRGAHFQPLILVSLGLGPSLTPAVGISRAEL